MGGRGVEVQRARRFTTCRPLPRKRGKSADPALLIKKKSDGVETCSGNRKTLYSPWMKNVYEKSPPSSNNEPAMKCALFLVRLSRGSSHALFSVVQWLTLKGKSFFRTIEAKSVSNFGRAFCETLLPFFCHLQNVAHRPSFFFFLSSWRKNPQVCRPHTVFGKAQASPSGFLLWAEIARAVAGEAGLLN